MRLLARLSISFGHQNGVPIPITTHFGLQGKQLNQIIIMSSGLLGAELITGQITLASLPFCPRLCKPVLRLFFIAWGRDEVMDWRR